MLSPGLAKHIVKRIVIVNNKCNDGASHNMECTTHKHTSEFQSDLAQALEVMRKGGIILYPTDTVWGIGCDATNSEAVMRIYNLKRRTDSKAMIVLVDSPAMLERHVDEMPEVAWQLIDVAVNPTTIVYDRGTGLAPELLAPDGSVGIRVTAEKFSSMLCRGLRRPLVSTSANISGSPTPQSFDEIDDEIIRGVDYVVGYRRDDNTPRRPSSVIKLSNSGEVKILRN